MESDFSYSLVDSENILFNDLINGLLDCQTLILITEFIRRPNDSSKVARRMVAGLCIPGKPLVVVRPRIVGVVNGRQHVDSHSYPSNHLSAADRVLVETPMASATSACV